MKLAVLAVAAVVLSGCSPVGDADLQRLALPVAGSDRSHADVGRVARRLDRRARRVPAGLRPDRLLDDPLPPAQRRRGSGPDPLQPADRGALHVRAGHHRRGVLLPHRHVAERHAREGQEPRPHGRGRRQQVAVGLQLPRRGRRRRARTSSTSARPRTRPSCGSRSTSPCASTCCRPTSSTRSGSPSSTSRWTSFPGRGQHVRHDADPRGRVHRTLRRALRPLPLTHDLQGPRGVARPSTTRTWSSSRTPVRQGAPKGAKEADTIAGLDEERQRQRRRRPGNGGGATDGRPHGGIRRRLEALRAGRTSAPSARRSSRSSPRPITR